MSKHAISVKIGLIAVMVLSATNASGQSSSALQRSATEKASPFGSVDPATGTTPAWRPAQNYTPVTPKANPALQSGPDLMRLRSALNITTAPLVLTGTMLNVTTSPLAFTGRQLEVVTPSLVISGLQKEWMTDRLVLTGKK
jgi:hypothetical protein